jgi:hypothetical protein
MRPTGYLFFALAILCETCHAENACPWINQATALGILGTTEGSPMAAPAEVNATSCRFTYHDEDGTRELRITVEQVKDPDQIFNTYKSKCSSSASPFPAIGNKAIVCSADKKGNSEEVIGQVRDSIFTITLSTSVKKDPSMPQEVLQEKIRLAAEQVSGNLF